MNGKRTMLSGLAALALIAGMIGAVIVGPPSLHIPWLDELGGYSSVVGGGTIQPW